MIGLTREMKIKSILKNHYLLIVLVSSIEIPILTKIKKMNHTENYIGEDVRQLQFLYIASGNVEWTYSCPEMSTEIEEAFRNI